MEFLLMISAHQVTPYFVKTALPIKKEGALNPISYLNACYYKPTTPSSLYVSLIVCNLLFNMYTNLHG